MSNTTPLPHETLAKFREVVLDAIERLSIDRATDQSDYSVDELVESLVEVLCTEPGGVEDVVNAYLEGHYRAALMCREDYESFKPCTPLDFIEQIRGAK